MTEKTTPTPAGATTPTPATSTPTGTSPMPPAETQIDAAKNTPSTPPAPPLASAQEVVANLMIPLVVELARVALSPQDIAALYEGYVIELSHRPSEPVDLVVGGKAIGKGELVNIEGELGIRIISLVH